MKKPDQRQFGMTLFPDKPFTFRVKYSFGSLDQLKMAVKSGHGALTPFFIGCVTYTDPIDRTTIHHTRWIYDIFERGNDGGYFDVDPTKGNIPQSKLILEPDAEGGSFDAD